MYTTQNSLTFSIPIISYRSWQVIWTTFRIHTELMQVFPGQPKLACPYVGVLSKTSLMSLSLYKYMVTKSYKTNSDISLVLFIFLGFPMSFNLWRKVFFWKFLKLIKDKKWISDVAYSLIDWKLFYVCMFVLLSTQFWLSTLRPSWGDHF